MHWILAADKTTHVIQAFIFEKLEDFVAAFGTMNVRGLTAFDHGHFHPTEKAPPYVRRFL